MTDVIQQHLFDADVTVRAPDVTLPKPIRQMHAMHGPRVGEVCGHCRHLIRIHPGQNTYPKCDLTAITHGPGTDWRVRWPACGRFEEDKS